MRNVWYNIQGTRRLLFYLRGIKNWNCLQTVFTDCNTVIISLCCCVTPHEASLSLPRCCADDLQQNKSDVTFLWSEVLTRSRFPWRSDRPAVSPVTRVINSLSLSIYPFLSQQSILGCMMRTVCIIQLCIRWDETVSCGWVLWVTVTQRNLAHHSPRSLLLRSPVWRLWLHGWNRASAAFSTTKTTTPSKIMSSSAAGVAWSDHRPKLQSGFSSEERAPSCQLSVSVPPLCLLFFSPLTANPDHLISIVKR